MNKDHVAVYMNISHFVRGHTADATRNELLTVYKTEMKSFRVVSTYEL